MIGNVTIAANVQQLQYILNARENIKVASYKSRNMQPPTHKVIVVDDCDFGINNAVIASLLLPDANATTALIEGDMERFSYFYSQKLMNDPEVKEYLIVVFTGLMEKGYDYTFFFDCDNNINMQPIADMLCSFLSNMLGLVMYSVEYINSDPNVLFYQSVREEYRMQISNAIIAYGYSDISDPQKYLFRQF